MLGVKLWLAGAIRVARQSPTVPGRSGWFWFLRDGLQPGLGWMLKVASAHANWKWVCCHEAQTLKVGGQAAIHMDSCHAMLACSPWWDGQASDITGCGAVKNSKRTRIACAKEHCTSSLFTQCCFGFVVKFICNKYNIRSPDKMNFPFIPPLRKLQCPALNTLSMHERGTEVYTSFKFKSQCNRFVLLGWHLIICPTSLRLNVDLNLGQVSGQNVIWHQRISVAQHAIRTCNVQLG